MLKKWTSWAGTSLLYLDFGWLFLLEVPHNQPCLTHTWLMSCVFLLSLILILLYWYRNGLPQIFILFLFQWEIHNYHWPWKGVCLFETQVEFKLIHVIGPLYYWPLYWTYALPERLFLGSQISQVRRMSWVFIFMSFSPFVMAVKAIGFDNPATSCVGYMYYCTLCKVHLSML